jgi:sulfotransferase
MSSPVSALVQSLLNIMSARGEWVSLFDDEQRENVLRAVFDGYYRNIHPKQLVFDTNRHWCARMDALVRLFPKARVIVCVRDLAWIMDSFERQFRKHPFLMSRMYSAETAATVYTRTASLSGPQGTVGLPWDATQEAFYGPHSDRLIVIDYEALAREPERAMSFIYEALGIPYFKHDFDKVTYEEGGEFDENLGIPGLHLVTGKVQFIDRPTVLPPDVFGRYSNRNFWKNPKSNPRKVRVVLPLGIEATKELKPIAATPLAGS